MAEIERDIRSEAQVKRYIPRPDLTAVENIVGEALGGLQSADPQKVAEAGRKLVGLQVTINKDVQITPLQQAFLDEAANKVFRDFGKRFGLACLLVEPSPESIRIHQLGDRIGRLVEAKKVFTQSPLPQDRMEALPRTQVIFWPARPELRDVVQAIATVHELTSNPNLPIQLINDLNLDEKVTALARETIADLVKLPDEPVEPRDPYRELRLLPRFLQNAWIVDLLAGQLGEEQVTDQFVDKVTLSLAYAHVGEYVRRNPHDNDTRAYLTMFARILKFGSTDEIAQRLEAIHLDEEDLRALTACSMFDQYALPFIGLAKLAGLYDKREYRNIVTRALSLVVSDS